ncbi:MAG: hypothetical protein WDO56_28265 [Gammaproteobacteria bacterium]
MNGTLSKGVAIAVLAIFFVWFGSLGNKPVAGGPRRIIGLELAPTVDAAEGFLQDWSKARPGVWQGQLRESLDWDTWFICAYAPLFALLCWVAAEHFGTSGYRSLEAFGQGLAGAQLLAGALDFVENVALRRMIDAGHATAPWPQISFAASLPKWILLGGFGLYVVAATGHWAVLMVRR